jgi:LPXTG-site transpeptidase (sortase) family protein
MKSTFSKFLQLLFRVLIFASLLIGSPDIVQASHKNALTFSGGDVIEINFSSFNDTVHVVAVDPSTNIIYAGGEFTDAGEDIYADYLSYYTAGWGWTHMPYYVSSFTTTPAFNAPVYALDFDEEYIYIGGAFTDVDNIAAADHVVRYNKSTYEWSALGSFYEFPAIVGTLNGNVHAIEVVTVGTDKRVYVGSYTQDAWHEPKADYLLYWREADNNWYVAVPNGINGVVRDILEVNGYLYVCGDFTDLNGIPDADYIARLNLNTNTWEALGSGLNAKAYAIEKDPTGNIIYAGGDFTNVGNHIAAYNLTDQTWQPLGSGVNNTVYTILQTHYGNNDLFIGGLFTKAGGYDKGYHVSHWNGTNWFPIIDKYIFTTHSLAMDNDIIYIAGEDHDLCFYLPEKLNSTTLLTSLSSNPTPINQDVTVKWTVIPAVDAELLDPIGVSGTVLISDGSTTLCSAPVQTGQCSFTAETLGTINLTASHSGDGLLNPSSDTIEWAVRKIDTSIDLNNPTPNPSESEQTVHFDWSLNVAYGAPPTDGTINILSSEEGAICSNIPATTTSCDATLIEPGLHTITAVYQGDSIHNSSSDTTQQFVKKSETTTVISGVSPNPSVTGQAVTVNWHVAAAFGTPTGSVTISTNQSGETCTAPVADGQCRITLNTAANHLLTASYSGSTTHEPGSTSQQHVVGLTDLTAPEVLDVVLGCSANALAKINGLDQINIIFSEDVQDGSGSEGAENPDNYSILRNGKPVAIASIQYNPTTHTSTLKLAKPLTDGSYQLIVNGTTSIVDLAGNHLGNNTDFILDFGMDMVPNAANENSILPASGFAPGIQTETASPPHSISPEMILSIPDLGVSVPIIGVPNEKDRWDVSWIGNNAGYLEGTAYPTLPGNTAITGHVTNSDGLPGPFSRLNQLTFGNEITIHANGKTYIYSVQENRTVYPNDPSVLRHEEYDWLTLITCQGYDASTGTYSFRRVVRAILVCVE